MLDTIKPFKLPSPTGPSEEHEVIDMPDVEEKYVLILACDFLSNDVNVLGIQKGKPREKKFLTM
jgi:hypothetical protein